MVTILKNSSVTKWTWSGAGFVRESPGEKQLERPKPLQLYKRARYYDPTTGGFISRDPLGYVDGMSLYRGYFAPDGMDPFGREQVIDPSNFGGGEVKGDGNVSVALNVEVSISDASGALVEEIKDGIRLQYDNDAGGCKKCYWLQFFWAELSAVQIVIDKKSGKKKAQQTPIPGKIVTSAVSDGATFTTDSSKKRWYTDSTSETEPCAGISTGLSERTDSHCDEIIDGLLWRR